MGVYGGDGGVGRGWGCRAGVGVYGGGGGVGRVCSRAGVGVYGGGGGGV